MTSATHRWPRATVCQEIASFTPDEIGNAILDKVGIAA